MGPRRSAAAVLIAATCGIAAVPAPAGARPCGGPFTGRVVADPPKPAAHPPPLVIGDSVTMLAAPALAAEGFRADARGCRMWKEGLDIVRAARRRHRLPHLVVLALGTNWTVRPIDISRALAAVGRGHVLGLVTPRKHGGRVGPEARLERTAARAHPRRIVLLDWVRVSTGHPELFQPDHLHLTPAGALAFAQLIATALPYARRDATRRRSADCVACLAPRSPPAGPSSP